MTGELGKTIIIAGSRSIPEYVTEYDANGWHQSPNWDALDLLKRELWARTDGGLEIAEIISGGALGVDRLGVRLAQDYDLPYKVFPADWSKYGKSAGYRRNVEMADYAARNGVDRGALLALWDGDSKGTSHMIDIATRKGLNVWVLTSKGN